MQDLIRATRRKMIRSILRVPRVSADGELEDYVTWIVRSTRLAEDAMQSNARYLTGSMKYTGGGSNGLAKSLECKMAGGPVLYLSGQRLEREREDDHVFAGRIH